MEPGHPGPPEGHDGHGGRDERVMALHNERRAAGVQLTRALTAASDPASEQHDFARSYLAVLLGRIQRLDAALERMVRPGRARS